MEILVVFKNSCCMPLLSSDGWSATSEAAATVREIKEAAKEKGVYITYLNGQKVVFTSIYTHTINVPAKALKSLEAFKNWNIERINTFYNKDFKQYWEI